LSVELEGFEAVERMVKHCIANGVITDWFLFNDRSVRVAPPLVISENELKRAADVIARGL